jgi:hypothetical protein
MRAAGGAHCKVLMLIAPTREQAPKGDMSREVEHAIRMASLEQVLKIPLFNRGGVSG